MAGIYLEKPHAPFPVTEVILPFQEGKTDPPPANTC